MVVPTLTATTPLIDVLPAEIGGEAMQKNALVGSDLSALGADAAMVFGSLLNVLGSPDADMTHRGRVEFEGERHRGPGRGQDGRGGR